MQGSSRPQQPSFLQVHISRDVGECQLFSCPPEHAVQWIQQSSRTTGPFSSVQESETPRGTPEAGECIAAAGELLQLQCASAPWPVPPAPV